jgi:hypothetical protein
MAQKARAAVLAEFTKAESFTDDDIVNIEDNEVNWEKTTDLVFGGMRPRWAIRA